MIYTLTRDDIPSLSAWIKKSDKPKLVEFFVFTAQNGNISTNWNLSNSQTEIYLFLYVATIPTTEAKKVIGAILTNKNSNPCIIVPATANSGSL